MIMSPQNGILPGVHEQLEYLNSIEARRRWPVILFISSLMFLGTFGNLNVLYIYAFRYKRSTYRFFVVTLAIIDLVACVVSMPFEIADEFHPYDYTDAKSCKAFRFINVSVGSISALMLVLIASERYRKICIQQSPQMSEYSLKRLTLALTLVSIIISSPALHVYGNKTVTIQGLAINGSECTWGDHMEGSVFGYVFYGYASLMIVTCMIAMAVLYSLVGCHLKKHANNMRRTLRRQNRYVVNSEASSNKETMMLKTEIESCSPCSDRQDDQCDGKEEEGALKENLDDIDKKDTASGNVHGKEHNPTQDEFLKKDAKDITKSIVEGKNVNPKSRKVSQASVVSSTNTNTLVKKKKSEKETKITKVLFTITVLFIMTYTPYIIILVVYGLDSQYEQTLSPGLHNLYLIGLRMYLINNAANCILYNYFDKKFRAIIKGIYIGIFNRCKNFKS